MLTRTLALVAAITFAPVAKADDVKDAEAKLKEYLGAIKGSEAGRVTALTADGVKETFPDHVLFSHVIPLYPVAREAPPPLKHANVIAIPKKKDGKPILITDAKALEKFFKENARPVKKSDEGDEAVKAWLRTTAELNQDGFFKFNVKAGPSKVEGNTVMATGEAPVDPKGNMDKGSIKATITFKEGKLASADTKVAITAGMRPRCQATKLLDPDPIVRLMAEDSIRVMGSSIKPYLDDQRSKASPQLREAIDRVWAKAMAEGR
ncbi:MAG: hypothetical protein L0241_06590 [Planctomycetia bacterium]|nr:hypothetical protein [Planctomycetia bacterium]